jgi:hypothetical protein
LVEVAPGKYEVRDKRTGRVVELRNPSNVSSGEDVGIY